MATGLNTADERDGLQNDVPTGADILVKSHNRNYYFFNKRSRKEGLKWVFEDMEYFKGVGILIIRDPFHAIRSCWNHIHGDASDRNIYSSAFQDFAAKEADRWFEVVRNWLILGQQVHVVFYEELVNDLEIELKKVVLFLKIKIHNERFECIKKSKFESNKRRKPKLPRNPFSSANILKINNIVNMTNAILINQGYETLPLHLYKPLV